MLIDAFTYFNEIEILEFRLRVLYDIVDYFYIVESDHTFSGTPKPYHSDTVDKILKPYEEKIVFYRHAADISNLDFSTKPSKYDESHDCWSIEKQQRNAIAKACWYLPDDAHVMMGDVDEIPAPDAVRYAITIGAEFPVAFQQWMFYYNLRHLRREMWPGTVFTNIKYLKECGAQRLRDKRGSLPSRIANGGFHLSFFGNADKIKNKIESFSHQELNCEEFTEEAHIAHCIASGQDLFNRDVKTMEIPKKDFPQYFKEYAPEEWW